MINDALKNVSITYCYSVPNIVFEGYYYRIKMTNFANEGKKKRAVKKEQDTESVTSVSTFESGENIIVEQNTTDQDMADQDKVPRKRPIVAPIVSDTPVENIIVEPVVTAPFITESKTTESTDNKTVRRRRPKIAEETSNST
jgi:hypothetical protein